MAVRGALGRNVVLFGCLSCPAGWGQTAAVVQEIEIRGTGRQLRLETHSGAPLDKAAVARDVRRLWATRWFEDVRVQAEDTAAGTKVIFQVVEKPRLYLRRVRFEPVHWKRPLAVEPGTPIDHVRSRLLAAALRRSLIDEGYAEAKVEADLIPAGFKRVDLRLRVEPGTRHQVQEVRFSGSPGVETKQLQHALDSTRVRWLRRPAFSDRALQNDVARLRSHYASLGYLDAQVAVGGVEFAQDKARITYAVESGSQSADFPARELCRCLLEARRESERRGELDFAARVRLGERFLPVIETAPSYTVERIEFRGHHALSDSTLRRALVLQEGNLFDRTLLRRSLARIDRLGLFETVTENDVEVRADPRNRSVRITIALRQRPRGRWSLSGPLAPLRVAGAPQFTIASRLPGWGYGLLEASTYYATFSPVALMPPVWRALGVVPRFRAIPFIALERPYLAGQGWQSGFRWSPELGWRGTVASYGTTQLQEALRNLLRANREATPPLSVSLEWADRDNPARAGALLCEAPPPRWAWVRAAGAAAADLLLAPRPF